MLKFSVTNCWLKTLKWLKLCEAWFFHSGASCCNGSSNIETVSLVSKDCHFSSKIEHQNKQWCCVFWMTQLTICFHWVLTSCNSGYIDCQGWNKWQGKEMQMHATNHLSLSFTKCSCVFVSEPGSSPAICIWKTIGMAQMNQCICQGFSLPVLLRVCASCVFCGVWTLFPLPCSNVMRLLNCVYKWCVL